MKLNRKQKEVTAKLIDWWEDQGLLYEGQSGRLKKSIELKTINWKKVAEYLMGLAVISIILAFLTLVADEWILEVFEKLFKISDVAVFVLLIVLTLFFYVAGWRFYRHRNRHRLSLETLLLLGSFSFGGALNYAGKFLQADGFSEILLILVFSLHAFGVSYYFKSIILSTIGWFGVMLWLGIESGRQGNWSGSWLGMNLVLRYLFFALVPLFTGVILKKGRNLYQFAIVSERTGWMFLWLALWGLALFGNHQTWASWNAAPATTLLPWGILMIVISLIVWIIGKQKGNREWMWMSGLALIANAYTQFFLYLWEPLHPALFFAIMGVSFWILGRRAEKLKR